MRPTDQDDAPDEAPDGDERPETAATPRSAGAGTATVRPGGPATRVGPEADLGPASPAARGR